MQKLSARTADFTDSVIRRMTRISNQHGAVNLSQGFPDFQVAPWHSAARRLRGRPCRPPSAQSLYGIHAVGAGGGAGTFGPLGNRMACGSRVWHS